MSTQYRIVVVFGHIVAQFNQDTGPGHSASWYTCSKANNNDERDFAIWPFTQVNLAKAYNLIGSCKLVEGPADCSIQEHENKWYIHRGCMVDDKSESTRIEALCTLARSL